jgi:hypothetical protein
MEVPMGTAVVIVVASIVTATTTGNEIGRHLESRYRSDWLVRWAGGGRGAPTAGEESGG